MKSRRLPLLVTLNILVILVVGMGLYALLTYRVVREAISEQILEDSRMLAGTVRDVVQAGYRFDALTDADISQLQRFCGSISVPNSGFVCVVDPGGGVLAGPPGRLDDALFRGSSGERTRRLADLPPGTEALGLLSYPESTRRELVASLPIGASGYRVQVHQNYAAVVDRANRAGRSILPLGLSIVVIVSLISFLVVDRIVERYEHRLSRTNKQLTASNNHRRHLIHVLSHDLKNAIGAILSAQEIVATYPEERELYQRIIAEGARNSLRIVDLVRMTEAVETGKLELQLQPVHLLQAALRAVEMVQNKVRRKNIEVDVDIDQGLYGLAEETSFVNSVLVNVLSNAVKFSPRGSRIEVRASGTEAETRLSVTDHGIGIPPELVERLFEPSGPTTRPGTEGENGTGFGLPLTGKFVTAYGGAVHVDSEEASPEQEGRTTVTISLRSVASLVAD